MCQLALCDKLETVVIPDQFVFNNPNVVIYLSSDFYLHNPLAPSV